MKDFSKVWARLAALLLIFMLVLAGCGGQDNPASVELPTGTEDGSSSNEESSLAEETVRAPEPVTVSMYNHFNNISDELAQQFLIDPLSENMPHVNFEIVRHGAGSTIQELVAAQMFTDLYYGSNFGLPTYIDLQLQQDMTDLIDKVGIDLNRFEDYAVQAVRDFGENGEMYGIPFSSNIGVLVYNKEIFDRFGVDYPVDEMTWDEVVDLGRDLTRSEEGFRYIGFEPAEATRMASALSVAYIDEENQRAIVDIPEWRMIFDLFRRAYAIPGYLGENGEHRYHYNVFLRDRTIAMMPMWQLQILNFNDQLSEMEWDMVSLPNFEGHVGMGREVNITMLAVSTVSQEREAAAEVVKFVTSDDVQMLMSQYGTPSVLKSPEIKAAFGNKHPLFEGKNIEALFKTTPAPVHKIHIHNGVVSRKMDGARGLIAEGRDINTIIREIEEAANSELQELFK